MVQAITKNSEVETLGFGVLLEPIILFLGSVEYKETSTSLSAGELILWTSQVRGWRLKMGLVLTLCRDCANH